jgi:hypothetical protein
MIRTYLKPGDMVTAFFIDLVVIKEAKNISYAISHLGDSELKYFPNGEKDSDGYGIKYAWDLNPKDEHYGKPYWENNPKDGCL